MKRKSFDPSTGSGRASGLELEENRRVLRMMRGLAAAFCLVLFCLGVYIGLFIAYRVYGFGS